MKYNLLVHSHDPARLPKSRNSLTNCDPGYGARMPCIFRENLLVGNSNIHERVDTAQKFNDLSNKIVNISEVIKDILSEHLANSGNFDNIENANTIAPARVQRRVQVFVQSKIQKIRLVPNIVKFVKWMKIQVKFLSQFKSKNLSRPIIGHININF